MAEILVELHLDSEAVIAAILYRSVRESRLSLAELEEKFGANVAKLVEGVLRMAAINETDTSRKHVLGQSDDHCVPSKTLRKRNGCAWPVKCSRSMCLSRID